MSTMPLEIILASRSPRRAALLKQMGIPFRILFHDITETSIPCTDPALFVKTLSRMKAEAVLPDIAEGLIVGADTIVYLDGEVLGKPVDRSEAKEMLQQLSGRTHEVYTGFTLIRVGNKLYSDVERTAVTFRNLEMWEIDSYVETDCPLDKAGGYGIQDRSGFFVERIDGCFYNVVGFPLTKFYEGLKILLDNRSFLNLLWGRDRKP
jgi:septum formation protein